MTSGAVEWADQPISVLGFHQGGCCESARAWFLGMGRSYHLQRADRGPWGSVRWLADKFKWGPTAWPAHWCEIAGRREIDCGAFSAVAREILGEIGCVAVGGQVVQTFTGQDCTHWLKRWEAKAPDARWLGEGIAYHEVCGIVCGERLQLFDPTHGTCIEPGFSTGYGAVIAVRHHAQATLQWGELRLPGSRWVYP